MKLETKKYVLPKGFKSIGFYGKIKEKNTDMAILTSEIPAVFAGVFTKNRVTAACVDRNKELLKTQKSVNAILVNSGNANACTGTKGEEDNKSLSETLALNLKIDADTILTASTGVIGVNLPMENMLKAISSAAPLLTSDSKGFQSAGKAILTTDLNEKYASVVIKINNQDVTISGIAKGSGMIHPNMATMLGFLLTDADINQNLLQKALDYSVNKTFNMISVDGDTSTNDMVLIMANGKAENGSITEESENFKLFSNALFTLSKYLAKSIARDGEGATSLSFNKV